MKNKVIVWGGIGEKLSNGGTQFFQQHRIYDSRGLAPALSKYKADLWIVIGVEDENKERNKDGFPRNP